MEERYERLAAGLEEVARANPAGFRRRLIALALVGQVAPLVLLVACAVGLVLLVPLFDRIEVFLCGGAPLAAGLVGAIIIIVQSLRVREIRPTGIEVPRDRAAPLFEVLDDLSSRLGCPRIERVLIDGRFGAVSNRARFGRPFARREAYVLLGYPLLCALSAEQGIACIAAIMACLHPRHDALRRWTYRVDHTWAGVARFGAASRETAGWDPMSLVSWYTPLFRAYQYAHAHQCEREADQRAAQIAGAGTLIDALVAIAIRQHRFDHVLLPAMMARVREEPVAPLYPLSGVAKAAGDPIDAEEAERALAKALAEPISPWHPCVPLRERAALLRGVPVGAADVSASALAQGPAVSAAAHFLGPWALEVDRLLDEWFMSGPGLEWRTRHSGFRQARSRLDELEPGAAEGALSGAEAAERARLLATLRSGEEAVAALKEHVAAFPEDAYGRFYLGCALLDSGDDEGFEHLDAAMRLAPDFAPQVCEVGYRHAVERQNQDAARRYQEAAQARAEAMDLAFTERHTFSPEDDLRPHGLPQERVDAVVAGLASERSVRIAYLVRKQTRNMPDMPFYVLAVVVGPSLRMQRRDEGTLEWRLNHAAPLPGDGTVIVLRGADARMRKPIRSVPGAEIYRPK